MKPFRIACVLIFLLAVNAGCSGVQDSPATEQSRRVEVPDFALKDLSGKTVRLSSFASKKPVLLMFWATWCPYCLQAMPTMVDLRNEIPEKDLAIIGVDIRESKEQVLTHLEKNPVNFTIVLDETAQVTDSYGVQGVPTFLVIDREGKGIAADNRLTPALLKAIRDESRA